MKIAFICHNFNRIGGIERCVAELSERLAEENEVHVFCKSWNDESQKGLIFHKIPTIKKPWLLMLFSFFFFSKRRIQQGQKECDFDIVHAHVPTSFRADVVTAHSVHVVGTRIAHKQRGFWEKAWYQLKTCEPFLFYLSKYNYLKGNYRQIIAISQSVKEELVAYAGCPANDIKVVYNGVNLKKFIEIAHERDDVKSELGILSNELILLFVANEFRRKGLVYLIKALAGLDYHKYHLKIVIAGESSDPSLTVTDCQQFANNLGIGERLIFIGKVSNVERYFIASDLFVFPTQYEPFGMVITEAMAAGLSVIVSRIAGAAELITDGVDGILLDNPYDVMEIKNRIEELISNPDRMREIGKRARKTIEKYTWDNVAQETLELYKSLIRK